MSEPFCWKVPLEGWTATVTTDTYNCGTNMEAIGLLLGFVLREVADKKVNLGQVNSIVETEFWDRRVYNPNKGTDQREMMPTGKRKIVVEVTFDRIPEMAQQPATGDIVETIVTGGDK